jgi:poly-gamma-glutamate synthesis protein (capsule biosynthesis protein)
MAALMFLSLAVHAQEMAASAIDPIPDAVWSAMQGKSFNPAVKGCAQRKDLRLLTLPYRDHEGREKLGQMILHRSVAADVRDVFVQVFRDKSFAIARMDLIDVFGGDDDASMAANNTSGYNCRKATGSKRLSSHALGLAIDVNPLVNPFVWKRGTSPKGGEAFDTPAERKAVAGQQPGLITAQSAITLAFRAKGWTWGGIWTSSRDYQHFSANGR